MQPGISLTPLVDVSALGIPADFAFTNVDTEQRLIEGYYAQSKFRVSIFAKGLEAERFVNPMFDVRLGDKRYCFELENGHTCLGCAIRLSCKIIATLQESATYPVPFHA